MLLRNRRFKLNIRQNIVILSVRLRNSFPGEVVEMPSARAFRLGEIL